MRPGSSSGFALPGRCSPELLDPLTTTAAGWRPEPGDQVDIQLNGATVRSGVVDLISEDHQQVWLMADGVNTRQLFDTSEGFRIRPAGPLAAALPNK